MATGLYTAEKNTFLTERDSIWLLNMYCSSQVITNCGPILNRMTCPSSSIQILTGGLYHIHQLPEHELLFSRGSYAETIIHAQRAQAIIVKSARETNRDEYSKNHYNWSNLFVGGPERLQAKWTCSSRECPLEQFAGGVLPRISPASNSTVSDSWWLERSNRQAYHMKIAQNKSHQLT